MCCRQNGMTAMSDKEPQPWEVWHARFDYVGSSGYKFRPVIVLATRPDGTLVTMVTSAANKLSLEHDYLIQEWEAAGLAKPSIARLDRIAEIPAGYLGNAGRIGRLAEDDIASIKAMFAEMIR